ncbi:hypothetical protein T484DRAFT_1950959, partial [Baffinella frigidus]
MASPTEGQRQGSPGSGDQEEAKQIAPGLQQHFPKSPTKKPQKQNGPKKRQKGDALYVVAARANPLPNGEDDGTDERCDAAIKRLRGVDGAAAGDANGSAQQVFRRIGACAVRLEEGVTCAGWKDFDVSVIQHRVAGPAAFLPPTLTIKAFSAMKGLGEAHAPVLRPMLVFVEQSAGRDGEGIGPLLEHLSSTRQMAQVVLRSQDLLCTKMQADYTFPMAHEVT